MGYTENFRFVHCSDLHLGSGFLGISGINPTLGKRLADSIFDSFTRVAEFTSKNADFMVISGDIFDEVNESPKTRFRFVEILKNMNKPCFIVLGNHDYRRSWEDSIPYPENVKVFGSEAETITINVNGSDVSLSGISFNSKHTNEDLASKLKGTPGMFSIGIVHCDILGTSDSVYAPTTLDKIRNNGIDYWALGHIHKREVISQSPYVVYSGNVQGLNRNESGPKGCYLVTVKEGKVSSLDFHETQEVIWKDITIDITDNDLANIVRELSQYKGNILNIKFTGRGELDVQLRLHSQDVLSTLEKETGCKIRMEVRTGPELDLEAVRNGNDMTAGILKAADKLNQLSREELISIICPTTTTSVLKSTFESMDDEELKSLITDAQMLLIDRMEEVSK